MVRNKTSSGKRMYMKRFNTQTEGMKTVRRMEKTHPDITLMDGSVGGFKTGYVVVTKKPIRGWVQKTIR